MTLRGEASGVRARTTGTYILIGVAAVVTLVMVLCRGVSVEAVYPIERARYFFERGVWSYVVGIFTGARARVENERLKREVASLVLARQDLERLEGENARLREALDYLQKASEGWVSAAILSRGGGAAGAGKTLRVNKGAGDGIRLDAVAVVPEGLVGIVTALTFHTAEVTMITDRELRIACEVETVNTVMPHGFIVGGTEDVLMIRHLTSTNGILPQARVVTSGRGGIYPKGLEVGSWISAEENEEGVLEGRVQPRVDFSTLEDVFIRCEK